MKESAGHAELFDGILLGSLFLVAFVVAFLAVPFNPTIPGTRLQVRPEPFILILAIAFGRSAVAGAAAGVLVHNFVFRLGPEITPFFSIAQTLTALIAGLLGAYVWTHLHSPLRAVAAPAASVAFFVTVLGLASAGEIGASAAWEMTHILEEALVPQLLLGPLAFAGLELGEATRRNAATTRRRGSDKARMP